MAAILNAVHFMYAVFSPIEYPNIVKKVAIGYNSEREAYSGCGYGTHSEMDAFLKLKNNNNTKSIPIDVYVIRINKASELRNSRPCDKCCKFMKFVADQRGYTIKNVFYTNKSGILIKTTFDILYTTSHEYISSHFKKKLKTNNFL